MAEMSHDPGLTPIAKTESGKLRRRQLIPAREALACRVDNFEKKWRWHDGPPPKIA
jgi:hypothetical protein